MTVASGRRPDAGALVPQQQGDGLVEPQTSPLECRGTVATAACRTVPRPGEERPEHRAWCFERRAGLRISKDRRSGPRQAPYADPEPAGGWAGDHGTGEVVVGRPARFFRYRSC